MVLVRIVNRSRGRCGGGAIGGGRASVGTRRCDRSALTIERAPDSLRSVSRARGRTVVTVRRWVLSARVDNGRVAGSWRRIVGRGGRGEGPECKNRKNDREQPHHSSLPGQLTDGRGFMPNRCPECKWTR